MPSTADSGTRSSHWAGGVLALLSGSLVTLALAPWSIWPLTIISLCLYLAILRNCSPAAAIWRGWLYGIGLFGTGTSWVYVSIHNFGNASVPLAVFLTAMFCLGLALLHALFAWIYVRFLRDLMGGMLLGFPALWVLFEWLRSWLLTGFPWMYLGYAAMETPLDGWIPVIGVFGASLALAFTASSLYLAYMRRNAQAMMLYATMIAILWLVGWQLQQAAWVAPASEKPLTVGMVQANIPQELKWRPEYYEPSLQIYRTMTEPLLGRDIILWPESAVPRYYQRAQQFLQPMSEVAANYNSALITGIPWREPGDSRYFNSIVALGQGDGHYHKQRLVPFGEYVPLEQWLRGLIDFFDLPMSAFSAGPRKQKPLQVQDFRVAPFICYEIVYPELVRKQARDADLMITISNDTWFGDSIGPVQHLQMARMRALENGRYLIRGTNNGISAIIDERGNIVAVGGRFTRETLEGEAQVMLGQTPFNDWGSVPALVISLIALISVLAAGSMGLRMQHDVPAKTDNP